MKGLKKLSDCSFNKQKYIDILKREVVPAVGCTEPVAVALAVAKARETLGMAVEHVTLQVSRNIYKNAMGVGVPGTGMVGLEIAAALAAISGESKNHLEVLCGLSEDTCEKAKGMIAEKRVKVNVKETEEKLYIEAMCENGSESATVIIKNVHTNICMVVKNGETVFEGDDKAPIPQDSQNLAENSPMTVQEIYDFIENVSLEELAFVQESIDMNLTIAREGIAHIYGVSIGKHLYEELVNSGSLDSDITTYAIALTSAASDARMAGCTLPVMSVAGSGNQGLTATLPVVAVAQAKKLPDERMLRGVALSQLVTIYIKTYIGKLSAICGCAIAASVGSACGITYLKGGNCQQLTYAIKNMIADISGLICDGAKSSCSLKIATAVGSAMRCSYLAIENTVISDKDGIIDTSLERTVENLGKLANDGMAHTDRVILDMMICK